MPASLPPQPNLVYVNGRLVPAAEANISVFDHGLLYGDGVFDTMFATYGMIFKLDRHLTRFERSLRAVHLDPGCSISEIREAVLRTVSANRLDSAYIKVLATRGVSAEPLLDPRGCTPTLVVFARPYISLADSSKRDRGLSAKLTAVRRISSQALDPRIKSLNYLNIVMAHMEATAVGCDEALILDEDGLVCEAPGYNVFAAADGTVFTPARSILEGITRETVIELCADLGIACAVRDVAPYDLYVADEIFLTSTAGGILPITTIDGREVGNGSPGPVLRQLDQAYDSLQESGRYGTPIPPTPAA